MRAELGAAVFAVVASSLPAGADEPAPELRVAPCRPTVTCTADLAPVGTLELELGYEVRRLDHDRAVSQTTPVMFKLPVLRWLEVQAGGNGYTTGDGAHYVDNLVVGAKLHLLDQHGARPAVAFTLSASVPLPAQTGYERSYDLFATAHASKDYGKLHVDANVGLSAWQLEGATQVQPWVAVAASYAFTGWFTATLEPHYFADADPAAPRDAGAIGAVAFAVKPWLVIDLAMDVVVRDQRSVAGLVGVSIAPARIWGGH